MAQDGLRSVLPPGILAAKTPEQAATLLGALLGLAGPAPLPATKRALIDPQFARALVNLRKIPHLRDPLLANPEAVQTRSETPSAPELLKKVAGSILKWGMEGLKPADPWVISRRLEACNACEFQAPAPDRLIYRGVQVVAGKDAKICRSCNCLTNTKAAISTEMCPEQDPDDSTRSRWGESWVPVEEHPEGPWRP